MSTRPKCQECINQGAYKVLEADLIASRLVTPAKKLYLCFDHAIELGYVNSHGEPLWNVVEVISLHTPDNQ